MHLRGNYLAKYCAFGRNTLKFDFVLPRRLDQLFMRTLPHTRGCFVCGESNVTGLRLRFETDGRIVQTQFVPQLEHIGFRHVVHGGITATVLDEVMVWGCAIQTKRFAYCAELNVRFLHPIRPGSLVVVQGELVVNRRNKLFETRGEVRAERGLVLATATGKYLPIKDEEAREFAVDFVGDVSVLGLGDSKAPD
jgi:acyl-coenzyme A thioesterase PaaI-like protein